MLAIPQSNLGDLSDINGCNNCTELVIKESHLRLADYSVLINTLERGINNSLQIGYKHTYNYSTTMI